MVERKARPAIALLLDIGTPSPSLNGQALRIVALRCQPELRPPKTDNGFHRPPCLPNVRVLADAVHVVADVPCRIGEWRRYRSSASFNLRTAESGRRCRLTRWADFSHVMLSRITRNLRETCSWAEMNSSSLSGPLSPLKEQPRHVYVRRGFVKGSHVWMLALRDFVAQVPHNVKKLRFLEHHLKRFCTN